MVHMVCMSHIILFFENENNRTAHSEYYLPKVKIKGYNVKIEIRKH